MILVKLLFFITFRVCDLLMSISARGGRGGGGRARVSSGWSRAGGGGGDVFSLLSSHKETNPDGIKKPSKLVS